LVSLVQLPLFLFFCFTDRSNAQLDSLAQLPFGFIQFLGLSDQLIAQFVEIHMVHRGNKWMGSLDLETSNKRTTSRTAGWGLKVKQDDNKTSGKAKQVKQGALGC